MKFELFGEVRILEGVAFRRIRALRDIPSAGVIAGDVGGWLDDGARLDQSGDAWVYCNAQVYGNARVSGDARVYGDARVHGNAQVYGNARVYGDAQVHGNAQVSGDARVYGDAWVSGDARVYGDARVHGNAQVYGNARVYGDAQVHGNARVHGDAQVHGDAWVHGDAHWLLIGPIGSRMSMMTVTADARIGLRVTTGCFSGSLAEFEAAIAATHGDNEHAIHYRAAIALIRARFPEQAKAVAA